MALRKKNAKELAILIYFFLFLFFSFCFFGYNHGDISAKTAILEFITDGNFVHTA